MTHRYPLALVFGIIINTLALFAYYQHSKPISSLDSQNIDTVYQYVTVNGPIQPIPKIQSIDNKWVSLGKALFNSPLLSKDNSVSCASCHMLQTGGDDGFPVSVGINGKTGTRNAPTVLNSVFNFRQFWDGRSADLADQVIGPIHDPIEMGSNFDEIIHKLRSSSAFSRAFNQISSKGITSDNIIRALVTFEESLVTPNAPIDKYILGDTSALTAQQIRGYEKFKHFGCTACHQGRNIGGNLYQRIGRIGVVPDNLLEDKGRYHLTKNKIDQYVFKVPSLRNIKHTAPYFHNGSVATLSDAILIMAEGQLGLKLSDEDLRDLLALFDAFTGDLPQGAL